MPLPKFLSLFKMAWLKRQFSHRIKYYPPFWLMRIKLLEEDPLWKTVRIKLPLTLLSRNPRGSMFGGVQASLADPIAALACNKLFPGFEVWTRHLELNFIREGRTDLELHFTVSDEQVVDIKNEIDETGRANPVFKYAFYDQQARLCTRVTCQIAIRPPGYIPRTRKIEE